MIALIIALVIIFLNHVLQEFIGHDAVVIDVCVGMGYILYMFL